MSIESDVFTGVDLSKILGETQNMGGNGGKADKCTGSQLLGARARAIPPKVYAYEYVGIFKFR